MTWKKFLSNFDWVTTYWGQLTEEQKKSILRSINEPVLQVFLNAMKEYAHSSDQNLDDVFMEYVAQTIENADESVQSLCLEIFEIYNPAVGAVVKDLINDGVFQYEGSFRHGTITLLVHRDGNYWYLETGGADFIDESYKFENLWDLLTEMAIYPFMSINEPHFL